MEVNLVAMNDSLTAAEMERRIITLVRERLPANWKVVKTSEPKNGSLRPDLAIEIDPPDGRPSRLVIEIKQTVERRDVLRLRHET